MVNVLYAVAAIACALISLILPARINQRLKNGTRVEKAFRFLIRWTAGFCLADGLWGITASELIMNDTLLMLMSCVFHSMAALTPAIWLSFVITYLGHIDRSHIYQWITTTIILLELVLIVINLFNKMMFYVDENGIYCSTPTRKWLFYMQYATYVTIGIVSFVHLFQEKKALSGEQSRATRYNYKAVLLFVASPILCGIFQMWYPDAPA